MSQKAIASPYYLLLLLISSVLKCSQVCLRFVFLVPRLVHMFAPQCDITFIIIKLICIYYMMCLCMSCLAIFHIFLVSLYVDQNSKKLKHHKTKHWTTLSNKQIRRNLNNNLTNIFCYSQQQITSGPPRERACVRARGHGLMPPWSAAGVRFGRNAW